uniref:Cleavage and polyadenylation specificity factor subunit 4 n=1 Tax=Geotrypetes seraphini TaxID=260995 RepID=A0A6P8SR44_GEOSA|nr:putative cleavage and polyadenylation specificity factor subunit 4-like protein isoform X2 [Geotrypetes seraphini]
MQDLIARVEKITFQLETDVLEQTGAVLLPFQGMDSLMCPFRHVSGEKTVVCKHWLRGLCKKGDQCEFLHEYDMTKMPECFFYSKFGECSNKECPFLHIDPALKIKDCPWYDRGFCKHGPACKHRHTRRIMCVNYLAGFCPEGPKCKFVHSDPVRFQGEFPYFLFSHYAELSWGSEFEFPSTRNHFLILLCSPRFDMLCISDHMKTTAQPQRLQDFPLLSSNILAQSRLPKSQGAAAYPCGTLRPLEQVTCFKCGERGHYANKCSKGRALFLMKS